MKTNIVRIGNTIEKTPARDGWEAAAKRMHEVGNDKLLIPDVLEDEVFSDWTHFA